MAVPTNIPEAPMVHTKHKSLHRSKGKKPSIPMEILQHVLRAVMGIMDDDQIESFSHWVSYKGYDSFSDICDHLHHISDDIYNYAEYGVNGIKYQLNATPCTKLKCSSNGCQKE